MSQTFTFPISAADQFNHGHERRQSRTHQRQPRLAASFPSLPRIPSGSTVPTEHTIQQHDDQLNDQHLHHSHSRDMHDPNRPSSNDPHAHLISKKRSFEARNTPAAMAFQHRHVSRPTDVLLHATENYSLLYGILADKESRRIFYFMLLNLAFMGVQSTYGYLTGSLGLISDSIHMFFDCVALLVGVCAAVMSKWPPSSKFPYGYGKIDTLAGLGNGIFLMLISVEIVYEAVERLFEGSTLERTSELLVVSICGLAVNMVGIFAFHGHHGHHGHDHGHGGHDHSHSDHSHDHCKPSNAASASPTKGQASGGHGHHHHGGENMQGIYLHIMADALGSVAVVISTLLVQFTGWSGFDPLASCIIAVLIFISTVPLVSSTTKILLLSLNSDIEYNLRDVLGGVTSIRGVVGYTVPKFWLEDMKKDTHDHHDHNHSHSSEQSHAHDHQQQDPAAQNHNHSHGHTHHHHASNTSGIPHCSDDHSHPQPPMHSHTHDHTHSHDHDDNDPTIVGTIHIQVSQYVDLRDVQARVMQYFQDRKMDVVVQYEREGENKCWCSATGSIGAIKTPQTGGMRTPMGGSFSTGYPSGFMAQQSGGSQMKEKGVSSPLGKML